MADLNRIREALRASMTTWATLESRENQALVSPAPDPDRLYALLERIDPEWEVCWSCEHANPYIVRVRLVILGVAREGLAEAKGLYHAKLAALAEAARAYGVVSLTEERWVEYDSEDGANTTELEAELEPVAAVVVPLVEQRDPQTEKARRHIEDLLDQLKAVGKGAAAAKVIMRGYGETLDESRDIYRELQAILRE